MTHATRVLLLKIVTISSMVLGLTFVLGIFTPVQHVTNLIMDLSVFPWFDGANNVDGSPVTNTLMATSGSVMIGWAIMFYLLVVHVYDSNPVLGGKIITISTIAWYVSDGVGAVMGGATGSAVMNLFFLACFLLPVHWPKSKTPKSL